MAAKVLVRLNEEEEDLFKHFFFEHVLTPWALLNEPGNRGRARPGQGIQRAIYIYLNRDLLSALLPAYWHELYFAGLYVDPGQT